jgi:hypothetical protein
MKSSHICNCGIQHIIWAIFDRNVEYGWTAGAFGLSNDPLNCWNTGEYRQMLLRDLRLNNTMAEIVSKYKNDDQLLKKYIRVGWICVNLYWSEIDDHWLVIGYWTGKVKITYIRFLVHRAPGRQSSWLSLLHQIECLPQYQQHGFLDWSMRNTTLSGRKRTYRDHSPVI